MVKRRNTPPRVDLTGRRFGMLVVLSRKKMPDGVGMWECRCDCGALTISDANRLNRGKKKSCGCNQIAAISLMWGKTNRKHGYKGKPVYKCWGNMIGRCHRPNHKSFMHYGGRGIVVCDRWRASFEAFLADMGDRPGRGYFIDRIDVNGNYEPGNCRWVPMSQQYLNRTDNHLLTAFGETKPVILWARDPRCKATRASLYKRLKNGWSHERAITKPMAKHGVNWRTRKLEWEKTA